jgi:hypothetical protein
VGATVSNREYRWAAVAGRKDHIAYGLIALKIDPEQIVREVR